MKITELREVSGEEVSKRLAELGKEIMKVNA